jgi:Fur family ferric uptake transcriptional regulator
MTGGGDTVRDVSDPVADILERPRDDGGRVTESRVAVVDALVNGPTHHVTANDLLDNLRRGRPGFHESTVYRTLERLVDVGAVTRIEVDGGPAVFHLAASAHHHVVCDRCGRVVGVDASLLDPVARRLRRDHGFVLRSDAVTLPGRCVDCDADHPEDVGDHVHPS